MDLIQTLKEKSELDRQRFEAELPVLAERVAHGEATENEVAAWVKSSGKTLDELQAAVDRQLEIDRLKALAGEFRERSLKAYRHNLEAAKYRQFTIKMQREIEHKTNHFRSLGWQLGVATNESREAFGELSRMTGVLNQPPKLAEDCRAIDAEFAIDVVAEAVSERVVSEPVVSEPVAIEPTKPVSLPQRERGRQNAEPVELPIAS